MNEDDSRDILIELRADMKHVRSGIEHLTISDTKQWQKLDAHGSALEGHEKTIGFLNWGVRLVVGGIVTAVIGGMAWMARH